MGSFSPPPVHAIYAAGTIQWCKGVTATAQTFGTFSFGGGCVAPVSSATYSTTDAAAFFVVQVADIVIGTNYEFFTQWRTPSGDLCNECTHDSGLINFNVNAITMSDSIQIAGRLPESHPGAWSVEVLVSAGGVNPISMATSTLTIGSTGPTTTTYTVTFSVSPGEAGANAGLRVDGNAVGSGKQFTWNQGEQHSVSLNKISAGTDSGTRYVFTGWSDGVSDTSRTITVTNSMAVVGQYKTQYLLTVVSDHATPGGGNWYDVGTTAHATLDTGIVGDNLFFDWVFTGWRGDASGANLQSNQISMDAARTATAVWDHRFSTAFYAIGALIVLVVIVVALLLLRKRGSLGGLGGGPQPTITKLSGKKKFCANCRAKIPIEATVCSKCGRPT